MLGKEQRIVAFQMAQIAAAQAFLVKMIAAIAIASNVLINRAFAAVVAEFPHGLVCAKLTQMAVYTAPSPGCVSVNRVTKLLRRELTVGVLGKKVDQRSSPLGLIIFLHEISSFSEFENHSQIISQDLTLVNSLRAVYIKKE